jgi:hypothetical protein
MKRIEGQVADSEELAKQVLSWITLTKRPLTTVEIQHALAMEVSKSDIDEENLPDIRDMISVCARLVTVDEESNIIRLIHYTTQEYFERTQKYWFPDAERDIAKTCVTYLSFDAFNTGYYMTDKEFKVRLRLYPLYDYAAQNWGYHAHAVSIEAEHLILGFLESEAKVANASKTMMAPERPRHMTRVHIAAYFGLKIVVMALLKKRYDPDSKDSSGRTPLSRAAERGHEAVVKLLLAKDGVLKDTDSRALLS